MCFLLLGFVVFRFFLYLCTGFKTTETMILFMNRMKPTLLLLLACMSVFVCHGKKRPNLLSERIGVCTSISHGQSVKNAGGHHLEMSLADFTACSKPDDSAFEANRNAAQGCVLPIVSSNGFFPGGVHVTGPKADHAAALLVAETALRRAHEVGITTCVLGSSGARQIPDGFSREEAESQFVELLKKLGPIAKKYGITIAIEPLRRQECNFINTVHEGYMIAKRVKHPNIRVNADIYHMLQEGEGPESIREAGRKYLRHVHVAENARRTAPGVDGDDFTPYLQALKDIDYRGVISIECGWENLDNQVSSAIGELKRQLKSIGF